MRRILFFLLVLFVGSGVAVAQRTIDNFDSTTPESTSVHWMSLEGGSSLRLMFDSTDKVEGAGALKVRPVLASLHGWGTYSQFGLSVADTATPWDFAAYDSVSIWLKVHDAPTVPGYMVLRLQFGDRPVQGEAEEQWIFEHPIILDNVTNGWINLRVPLFERSSDGTVAPDSTGFVYAPLNWGGLTWNNKKLDRDKISEWSIAIVVSGWDPNANLPADSLTVSFDNYELFGTRAVPFVIFNGKVVPPPLVSPGWSWGQSSIMVEEGTGPVVNSNSIKWTQGNEYGNGWTGMGWDVASTNIAGTWIKDSLSIQMQVESGVGPMRFQFESAAGKRGTVITPTADGQWHDYAVALKDFTVQDGAAAWDSTAVIKFGVMAEGSGIAGKVIRFGHMWTGNPSIDVIAPPPPTGLAAAGASFTNLITWNDVPNEPGIRYNVYMKSTPWTSVNDSTVEDLPPFNVPTAMATDALRYPVVNHDVTLYYGVVAKDAAGNVSDPAIMTTPVTTLAKGVPTISLTPPATFAADGDVSEWSGVAPFDLSVVSGSTHAVPNFPITSDADLRVKAYLAMDAANLYVAFDVDDDIVSVDTTATDYEQDCPDLFIGLYDWRGKHHSGYRRGATPDYHLRFSKNRIKIDNDGGLQVSYVGGPDYSWTEKILTSGYVVEARIPFAHLASIIPGGNDVPFVPVDGKRIPIDFSINDRDQNATRSGIMCYSTLNNDNSWQDMFNWTYTWVGTKTLVGVEKIDDQPVAFALKQNYPNPFNPSTQIAYSLQKAGYVSLKVYDVVGREVATLVDGQQDAGNYLATFNTSNASQGLSSGVYFYRLVAGSFMSTQKMMLLK